VVRVNEMKKSPTYATSLGSAFAGYIKAESVDDGRVLSPGSQYVLSLLRGGYLGEMFKNGGGRAALDVGCGKGYDLVSLDRLGWQTFGCEIASETIEAAEQTTKRYGAKAEIRLGENCSLPFGDGFFDLLLSLNNLHYVGSKERVGLALREYARVLSPGGGFIAHVIHPKNWLLKNAGALGDGVWQIKRNDDFRQGMNLYVFRSKTELRKEFDRYFSYIDVGIISTVFAGKNATSYLYMGIRK
jgi:SAM-dependent methyltransferase